ncbi:hypothetical protein LSTR_LSTR009563 [Laodelphax striatellus]|uniref:peptidylprolyl isomerase n=1 Tax=Laodelphax striatellus TaxID=195883 RepID=A0A482WSB5_LAOST|nr:hypothetical protein LSTR_LSTR009563 [Laodelphax striatellus]
MSVYSSEHDPDTPSSSHRLAAPLPLRDLIQGREFQMADGDYCEDDYNLCEEEFRPEQIKKYINFDALDLDVDENDKVICFADLRKKMTPVTADGRIMKRMKRQGLGEIIPNAGVVYYHYTAYANLEEEPFDNSYLRGNQKPQRLVLDKGAAILGVEIAVKTMKKGEESQFLVEPEYAFGKLGCPPRVPPEATILFQIEIVDFVELSDTTETAMIEHEETPEEKYKRLYKAAKDNHALGNDFFRKFNYKMAAARYRKARDILLDAICKGEEDEKVKNHLLLRVFSNLAICYSKIGKPNQVCMSCRDAFYYNEEEAKKNPKLYYYWGLALLDFGEFCGARNKLKAALRLHPNSEDVKAALKKLDEKQRHYEEKSRMMCRTMFSFNGAAENKTSVTVDEEKSDLKEEIVSMLKEKFNEARKNGIAEMVHSPEVQDSIKDMCAELATRDLQFFSRGNKLIISKRS